MIELAIAAITALLREVGQDEASDEVTKHKALITTALEAGMTQHLTHEQVVQLIKSGMTAASDQQFQEELKKK